MKLTLKEIRNIIRSVIKEDVVQSVAMSSEVDQSIKSLINAAATELRDLDQGEFRKLASNKQAVMALKNALNQALRQGLSSALKSNAQSAQPQTQTANKNSMTQNKN